MRQSGRNLPGARRNLAPPGNRAAAVELGTLRKRYPMDDLLPIDPDYSTAQEEELGRVAYFLDELRGLLGRGMIAAEAFEVVQAEKARRRGEIEGAAVTSGAF